MIKMIDNKEGSHHLLLRIVEVLLQAGDSPRIIVMMITMIIVIMVMMAVMSKSSWMTMIMNMLLMRRPLFYLVRAFISSSAAERDFCLSSSWRLTWMIVGHF